jgi:hypothetical protein
MPAQVTAPGVIETEGAFLNAPMRVHKGHGRLVFSKKTRLWFRVAAVFWALAVLMFPFMIYDELFNTHTTRFTCDRGTGVCEVNGQSKYYPRVADIKHAVLSHDFNRRDGANYGINLVTRDGKTVWIEEYRAIKDSVVADYRSAVKTINAYLADPGQQKLDVSFTYRAALKEILKSIFYLIFGGFTLMILYGLWVKRHYIFENGKVTLIAGRPFRHQKQEIEAGRIRALVDRQVAGRRRIELRVDGDNDIPVISAPKSAAPSLDPIALELAELLGKPVERATG